MFSQHTVWNQYPRALSFRGDRKDKSMNDKLDKLRHDVYKANMELFEKGLVIYTFGNASGIDRESGTVVIKPSGVDYDMLSPDNMVMLDLDGTVRTEGSNPSSDTKTHLKLYREYEGIGGVVHTHSRYATAWAQARRPLPCLGTTHADYFYGEVPCTRVIRDEQIARNYEEETGSVIIEKMKGLDVNHMKAVLVACHGPFVWGKDPDEAVYLSVMLEEVSHMAFMSVLINPEAGNIKQTLLDKHYLRKHGKNAYYGQKNNSV